MIDIPRDDVVVMLEAGYIFLAMKKFKEARSVFQGVCELAPKHEVPLVALSNVFFAQGKYLEAIRTLKQSIKEKETAYAYSHLGEAQLFYGKKDDALASLQKASELDPGSETKSGDFARSLIKLLETGYDPKEFKKAFAAFMKERKAKEAEAPQAEEKKD